MMIGKDDCIGYIWICFRSFVNKLYLLQENVAYLTIPSVLVFSAFGSSVLVGIAGVVVGGPSSMALRTFCASSDCLLDSRSTCFIINWNASAPTEPNEVAAISTYPQ